MALVQRKDLYSPKNVQPEYFSDFLTNLDYHPIKKDVVRYTNEAAVKQSIRNIILTRKNDRIYNPSFGSQIYDLLFEPFTETTKASVQSVIETAIRNHEPRVNLELVKIEGDIDTNTLFVTIVFSIINKEEPVILELILNRIR